MTKYTVIWEKRCEEMRSYSLWTSIRGENAEYSIKEKWLRGIIARNGPISEGKKFFKKKSRYGKIQSHKSYLIQNGLPCDITIKYPNTGRILNSTKDAPPHTKGFNFTLKISVETWHARRVEENKDPTKWQSCPSDAVIETCQNKCAWWSIITLLEERAF